MKKGTKKSDRLKKKKGAIESSSSSFIPHPSSLRVLLWDLDGTLVRGTRKGAFKDYTAPMLETVFGTAGCLRQMKVAGMTDLQIVEEALRGEKITRDHITARLDELRRRYVDEMKRACGNGQQILEAMPGGREVLARVSKNPRYSSALLTGNIEPAARLKLEITGLAEFFQLPGAFGDDSFDRRDLPGIAAQRINQHLGAELQAEQFIVIGDTPNDIACARHFGARVVSLATGRFYTAGDLAAHEPDALLPDLADTELVMATLDRL